MSEITRTQSPPAKADIKALVSSPTIQGKLAKIAGRHFDSERFAQAALLAISRNEKLALCTPESLLECLMTAAQQGWTIGGPRPSMYLVPYGKTCTAIPSYYGFQQTARESGGWEVEARVVHEGDTFRFSYGLTPELIHTPQDEDDSPVTHVYAVARSGTGSTKFEVMTIAQVAAIRKRSRAADSGPWVTDFEEMAKKTVVRRLCKYLPSSPNMDTAIELSDKEYTVVAEKPEKSTRMNMRKQIASTTLEPPNVAGEEAPPASPPSEPTTTTDETPATPPEDGPTNAEIAEEYAALPIAELRKELSAARVGSGRMKSWTASALAQNRVAFLPEASDEQIRAVARSFKLMQLEAEA